MMLHDFRDVILGRPGRDAAIENVQKSIRVAGRVGIPVVEYNFYAYELWADITRARAEAAQSIRRMTPNGTVSSRPCLMSASTRKKTSGTRYTYFLKAVIPVAEKAGIKIAVHPNDPPVPMFRGVAQILGSIEGLKRLVDIVPEPRKRHHVGHRRNTRDGPRPH